MNRRQFGRIFAGVAASVAVPVAAVEVVKARESPPFDAGPFLLERMCDGGRAEMGGETHDAWVAEFPEDCQKQYHRGCGIPIRWWFGMHSVCPRCGRHYLATHEQFRSGHFKQVPWRAA